MKASRPLTPPPPVTASQAALESYLRGLGPFVLAYSGGLDSRFLAWTAKRLGLPVTAVHVRGPHIAEAESEEALAWAQEQGIHCQSPYLDPLQVQAVAENAPDRCYHCKHSIFSNLIQLAEGRSVCDGSNVSDRLQYRPGRKALAELNIRSPLAEAGFGKAAIRAAAACTGMDRPNQKARPCLLTRLDYGMVVSAELLQRLDRAESVIAKLLATDFAGCTPDFRLRQLKTGQSELHLLAETIPPGTVQRLHTVLNAHGFTDTTIRPVETLSGYFDRQAGLSA